ncbi:hypothetical protein [uncultured Tateyamaria sp.]|uniref:hypothetical protein n=1 Tax=uncultured Tateyamaria sp. TaxID=455651 RepID=UPI002607D58D|nr:hypothetical protein [uncultured Tateyamaria sp.]
MDILTTIGHPMRQDWRRMVVMGLMFALLMQVLMMIALMVRFQALPNYVVGYDWIGNVIHIIKSTPSWSDILPIVNQEWLIEIGKMNYDYGTGISEWSLNVVPIRMMVLFLLGALVALCLSLLRRHQCDVTTGTTLRATTGIGTILIAMTNATMSWVVCCAAPSWVVGLAMLGLGVSTSLALESMGPALNLAGFGLLLCTIVYLAWRKTRLPQLINRGLKNA